MVSIKNFLLKLALFFSSFNIFNTTNKCPDFAWNDWEKQCVALPHFDGCHPNPCKTVLSPAIINGAQRRFFDAMQLNIKKMHWVNGKQIAHESKEFQAYVQKVIVPTNAIIAFHGDIHGDMHSLNRFITDLADKGYLDKHDSYKIVNPDFYMVFLGDYVDRGWYGAEVLHTIMRLKIENPDRVFMVRGNHEEIDLNVRYGFVQEIKRKFPQDFENLLVQYQKMYNVLPLALYIGAGTNGMYNMIQCCHGGIEIGFDPRVLLEDEHKDAAIMITDLKQQQGFNIFTFEGADYLKRFFKNSKPVDSSNGFMWSDFIVNPYDPLRLSSRDGMRGTMFEYGKLATEQLLAAWSGKTYVLRSIFRAHQHGCSEMRARILNQDGLSHSADAGIGKLWIGQSIHKKCPERLDNVPVVTFSVAPESGYQWPMHTYGLLFIAPEYDNWRLCVMQPAK